MTDLVVEDKITEEQFEAIIYGQGLTNLQREALRKYYNLPYDEGLLSLYSSTWEKIAASVWQKIKGKPLSGLLY
jgi:hypothetical protein